LADYAIYPDTQPVSIASMPSTPVTGTFWQTTQPVSIASMPSTPVTGTFWQDTQPVSGSVTVSGTDIDIRDLSSLSDSVEVKQATASNLKVDLSDTGANTNALKVDGSAVTQPVSAASLPLPTGASLDATLTNATQKTQVVDGSGNVIGATSNALDINIKSGNPTSITANAGTNLNTSALAIETGGNLATVKTNTDSLVTSGGGGYVRQDSTGTIAKETGGNLATAATSLSSIESQLTDMTLPDTGIMERFEVNGYVETEKTYTNVGDIDIIVETDDKEVRLSLFGQDTTTNYLLIDSSKSYGYGKSNIGFLSYTVKLKGNTESDTAIVTVIAHRHE